jgi:streptogramin lyase
MLSFAEVRRFGRVGMLIFGLGIAATPAALAQAIEEFPVPTAASKPYRIAAGADGALWYTGSASHKIGRITTAGAIQEFNTPTANSAPTGITLGPDGNMWFAETSGNKIGRITPGGTITEFAIPTANSQPFNLVAGPDGNVWFTEFAGNKIGRITPAGVITEFVVPTAASQPTGIASGPDGNLWFTETSGNKIGRITTLGAITEFPVPTAASAPLGIAAGPDGAMWFVEFSGNKIGRITTLGVISEFTVPTLSAELSAIVAGPDGAMWFVEANTNKIGRIGVSAGAITEFIVPTVDSRLLGIAAGPDGNVWFSGFNSNKIGKLTPPAATSGLLAATLPASRSVKTGTVATAFATIINTGAAATNCGISPITPTPAKFAFQTTSSTTNAATGTPNTRVNIPANGTQSFVVAFDATGPFASGDVRLGFGCTGVDAAVPVVGLSTLLMTFDANPVADMIAVGLTASNDGFARIPSGGQGAFVTATANIGVTTVLTARARLFDATTPVTATVCETVPATGACKAPPAASVTRSIAAAENAT